MKVKNLDILKDIKSISFCNDSEVADIIGSISDLLESNGYAEAAEFLTYDVEFRLMDEDIIIDNL